MKTDKIILSNKTALKEKYGANLKSIEAAIKKLIAADKKKGLQSKLIYIDQSASMKTHKAPVVKSSDDAAQVKRAIDSLYKKIKPDYIMLLGSVDVIPHVELRNMIRGDDDDYVPSDLPYACSAPYSERIADFLAPTRVIGRLPDITGSTDYKYLVCLIENAIAAKPESASAYKKYFALSAKVWQKSTEESIRNMFEKCDALKMVPASKAPYIKTEMNSKIHFYNCHGSSLDPQFYGQHGEKFPTSICAEDLAKNVAFGTVVAAECCYGAELYNPEFTDGKLSISNTYLGEGAIGYVGSTTVAYGPAEGQGLADLITQYFIRNVNKGASLGRAFLDARLRFIDKCAPRVDPQELKTAAQFLLLGDPSVQPVQAEPSVETHAKSATARTSQREDRRTKLVAWGDALDHICKRPIAVSTQAVLPKSMKDTLVKNNFKTRKGEKFSFSKNGAAGAKGIPEETCSIFIEREDHQEHINRARMLVVRQRGNEVIEVKTFERK